ncbi:hypothetical protein GGR20_003261 [Devosia subaequoris]|uniref:DUF2924 domain-containing protein n=1 Tax=Devosia subaequoris TaxID=395930 RepID=A0A7W6IQ43_9HYPH|nr:DUF2924 domain-containing protein [Devosia subaequoris]MBB4053599.1 hypothetical protein [Devosia subaequoris]
MDLIQTDYLSKAGAEEIAAGPPHSPPPEHTGSSSLEDERKERLRHDLAQLAELDINGLRVLWRKRLRTGPPDLPRSLLMRLLAYRLQAKVHGDLDRATQRYLERIHRETMRERQEGTRKAKAPPTVPPVLRRRLGPGTLLVREFGNDVHTVTVTTAGFLWQGAEYQSLSDIARRITGTRWNGPRFFGLREKDTSNAAAGEGK